jgi:hypothetical protein
VSEPTTPRGPRPAEDVFAERVAPLLELVERWRARIGTEAERWPAVPLPELEPDDPRRLAAEIAEELLRAHGHLVAAEERVRARPRCGGGCWGSRTAGRARDATAARTGPERQFVDVDPRAVRSSGPSNRRRSGQPSVTRPRESRAAVPTVRLRPRPCASRRGP